MTIELAAFCNTDDAYLVWKVDEIADCLGFAIERVWIQTGIVGREVDKPEYLLNRVGFAADVDGGAGQRQPSNIWPFQRYDWTDHEVSLGDVARYRIVPMTGTRLALSAREDLASPWQQIAATQPHDGELCAFFNRPMAASQWMARLAAEQGITTSTALVNLVANVESEFLRDFCGGTLIVALRELFDVADENPTIHLYAALFELEEEEVTERFCRLGERAHVVLSNGSPKVTEPDPNEKARHALKAAGCAVVDRLTAKTAGGGNLGHNKFIIVVEDEEPVQVWTGSTNLTPTGLFSQINNAVLIKSKPLADQFMAQWTRLAEAGSEVPSTLKKTNAAPGTDVAAPAAMQAWFTPTVKQTDLRHIQDLVEQSDKGILFLSFMPGTTGPVLDILEERAQGSFVRGVVNQWVGGESGKLVAALTGGSNDDPMDLDAFTPQGIKNQFAFWAKEFSKGGKISVLIHSKVMCIDPFGDHPIVITGSHNFSSAASEGNDENFLVIQNDKTLAQAYATHIISVYNHYRWRQYVALSEAKGHMPWQKLDHKPVWQASRISSNKQKANWKFWLGN
ncbi:phospholipase D-like domain-containing protein [Acidovorax sp. LjRoot118]|uniref:phospholipase D-like domain-containing protein n=1 Tax=Acidovorax sp. LjRoot118 TaxID=3342256 RepID=UPI003ED05FEA